MSHKKIVIPVTPGQKRVLVRRAKALDLSVAEFVCHLAEGFRLGADDQILAALASELKRSAKENRAALRSALAEVKATLAQLQTRRASRGGERHREDLITSQLNKIYEPGGEESPLDREATLLQSRSLPRGG
jgi:hypothetical protein